MSNIKKTELLLLVLWNIPAFLLSWFWGNNLILTGVFFFGVPAAYLSIRRVKMVPKVGIIAAAAALPIFTVVDYIAHVGGAWFNPSIFDFRIFNTYPIDDLLWSLLCFYYILAAYEYFFEKERLYRIPSHVKAISLASVAISVFFTAFIYITGSRPVIPYTYLFLVATVMILPLFYILLRHPKITRKAFGSTLFFLPLFLPYEYVAITQGNWEFPGQFIGWIYVLGASIPIEELLWLILATPTSIAYYEILGDDGR